MHLSVACALDNSIGSFSTEVVCHLGKDACVSAMCGFPTSGISSKQQATVHALALSYFI